MFEREKKKFPSQEPALIKSRREIRQLEESLRGYSDRVKGLEKENGRLKQENDKLKDELKALRKPPSWAKPNKSESSKKRAKKKGPKYGHSANVRKLPERIDREVNIIPQQCPGCEGTLPKPHKWHDHYQVDIPPPTDPIVTRYHVGWSWCRSCGKEVSNREKLSGSLYGPNLHSQVSYWKFKLGLTFGKIRELLQEQYKLPVSRGQLASLVRRSAASFNMAYEDLRTSLLDQAYVHADETGWRESGESKWLWSFSNRDMSLYTIEGSRGQKVVESVLGTSYGGILCSDFYGGYNKIGCRKQKCWRHLLSEARDLRETSSRNREIKRFVRRLKRFFCRGVALQKAVDAGGDVAKRLARLEDDTMRFALHRWRHPDLQRLSKRLIKHRRELYVFVGTGVDPTNNHAEREIRPAVLMRKTSYGNRSSRGSKDQAILMSMIRTAQKRNVNFVQLATQTLIDH